MRRLHIFRNLHTALLLSFVVALLAGIGALWWANRTGLPDAWRARLEHELGKQGAHLTIGAISYIPFKGIVARDVRIFSDIERRHELSRLERILIAIDRTKLARGKFRLTKIELSDADISLPVDPKDPQSETLRITGASGVVSMPGGRFLEVRDARGKVAGINVVFGARLLGYRQDEGEPGEDPDEGARRELLAKIVEFLEAWRFDENEPPELRVFAEGDLSDKSTLTARVSLRARGVEKNFHLLEEVTAEGTFAGNIVTFTSLRARDAQGAFDGRVDYDLDTRLGRFDVTSSLEIPTLLEAWLNLPSSPDLRFDGRQWLEAEGDFRIRDEAPPLLRVTGHARCHAVTLRGIPFDTVESAFSSRDGNLYLRDLHLSRADGRADGKVLVQDSAIRLALRSSLPVAVYRPLFEGQFLGRVLDDFGEKEDSRVELELDGGFDRRQKDAWAFTGRGRVENMAFNDVPLASAETRFALSHHELDFFQGAASFDYTDYPLRLAFKGPARGNAKLGRIRYESATKAITVENLAGSVWAAPLIRLFAPEIADTLEIYRFHRPPDLRADGLIDLDDKNATSLAVTFRSDQPADYEFLGENLTLSAPSGKVLVGAARVDVSDLSCGLFGGTLSGAVSRHRNGRLSGEFNWARLSLPAVASAYDFDIKGQGTLTGRLDFSLQDKNVATMSGEGLIALEQTELFSVPLFGPLDSLVANVLSDKKGGFERAKDAFFSFTIEKGVLSTSDFRTASSSLNFTGDGQVDLNDRTVDVTMRMNARGFLGLITLPLRPFYGLFQFRGTGPLKKPVWESVLFTSPPEEQRKVLLDPPKARAVAE